MSLPGFLDAIENGGTWKPINNKIAIVNANNSYSAGLTKALREVIGKTKWQIGLVEEIVAPLTEWGPTLAKLRSDPHAVIWVTDYFPADLAAFTKQFVLDPTPSILHQQYGPSVPEYLDLAGAAGNGVTWASVLGNCPISSGKAMSSATERSSARSLVSAKAPASTMRCIFIGRRPACPAVTSPTASVSPTR